MSAAPGEEIFDVVDETGRVIGQAPRSRCHGHPELIHQAVHVLVTDGQGRLLLQKRSRSKDVQPGRWDSSVGGHMQPGEAPEAAARREMKEELGLDGVALTFCYQYLWRSPTETELVRTYAARSEGPFAPDPAEVDEVRFWTLDAIRARLGEGVFTPNFEHEFQRFAAAKEGMCGPG